MLFCVDDKTASLIGPPFILPALCLLAASLLRGDACPDSKPNPNRVTFTHIGGGSCGEDCRETFAVPEIRKFFITTVVGPGFGPSVRKVPGRTGGYLADSVLNSNLGVVSRNATLRIRRKWHTGQPKPGFGTQQISLRLNGWPVDSVKFVAGEDVEEEYCKTFPIHRLVFAERLASGTTEPGENEMTITGDGTGCNWCGVSIEVEELSFEAMPPVVLVHGFNSSALAFAPVMRRYDAAPRFYCEVDPKNLKTAERSTNGFLTPLLEAGVPFDCFSASVDSSSTIEEGGKALADNIKRIAGAFGRRFVHVIAHSKGGLWAREALMLLEGVSPGQPPMAARLDRIGVLSVTTLDTPHHGSLLAGLLAQETNAQILAALSEVGGGGLLNSLVAARTAAIIRERGGYDDLTPEGVGLASQWQREALTNLITNGSTLTIRLEESRLDEVKYRTKLFSVSADPDVNGNRTLDSGEAAGLPKVDLFAVGGAVFEFWAHTYQILRRFASFTSTSSLVLVEGIPVWQVEVHFIPNAGRPENDVIVPVDSSAAWPSLAANLLTPIPGPRGFGFSAHHTNIVSRALAPTVLQVISSSLPVQR